MGDREISLVFNTFTDLPIAVYNEKDVYISYEKHCIEVYHLETKIVQKFPYSSIAQIVYK